jgi:hypothetical protein
MVSGPKQTYVYVRTEGGPRNGNSNGENSNDIMTSCCWVPALQLKSDGKHATVSMPLLSATSLSDMTGCGNKSKLKFTSQPTTISLKDYDNHVLPMQNVDANGNIEDYKDMVELPFMHEVRFCFVCGDVCLFSYGWTS